MRRSDTKYIITNDTWNAKLFLSVKLLINRICVWKSLLNSNDLRQSLKSLEKHIVRNGTLIIESSLRLQSLLINNYGNNRTRYTPSYNISRLTVILIHSLTRWYGLPSHSRQLDCKGFRNDTNVWESKAECVTPFIYVFDVVW